MAWASWCLVCLVWGAGAAALCCGETAITIVFDAPILQWFWLQRSERLDVAFSVLTWLGSLVLIMPLTLVAVAVLLHRERIRHAAFLAAAVFGASALAHIVKLTAARPRPALYPALIAVSADTSFPSAHAAQIVALVFAALYLLARISSRWTAPAAVIGTAAVVSVCLSRLYLQVHFPSDVVAGALGAGLWVAGLGALLAPPPSPPGAPDCGVVTIRN